MTLQSESYEGENIIIKGGKYKKNMHLNGHIFSIVWAMISENVYSHIAFQANDRS